jgi:hypothetical protein
MVKARTREVETNKNSLSNLFREQIWYIDNNSGPFQELRLHGLLPEKPLTSSSLYPEASYCLQLATKYKKDQLEKVRRKKEYNKTWNIYGLQLPSSSRPIVIICVLALIFYFIKLLGWTVKIYSKINTSLKEEHHQTAPFSQTNADDKEYNLLSGLNSTNWWIITSSVSLFNTHLYLKKEKKFYLQYNEANSNYVSYITKRDYIKSQLSRGGTICEDGWRSDSYGQGTCSHHGGIDESISWERYNYYDRKISKYEEIKTKTWLNRETDSLLKTHLWAEFWIILVLLWAYKVLKTS